MIYIVALFWSHIISVAYSCKSCFILYGHVEITLAEFGLHYIGYSH